MNEPSYKQLEVRRTEHHFHAEATASTTKQNPERKDI